MTGGLAGRGYVPGLDGLRALAVIGVLIFHDDRLSGGFLGVDLFFALSGLLITSLLIEEHRQSGTVDLIGFWGRRLRRLLPAVLALLVVTVIAFRFLADTGEWIVARTDAPWAQFYVANWHLIASGNGYWDSFAAPSAFEHLWSLAIEEQFYLIWPILVLITLRQGGVRALTWLTITASVISVAAMIILADASDPTRVYMGTDTRAFSLLAGAMLALPWARESIDRWVATRTRLATLTALGLTIIIVGMWVVADGGSNWLFAGGLAIHSFGSAILGALVVAGVPYLAAALAARPLVAIGRLSYSLYLWHWPVYVFASPERFDINRWALTLIRIGVSVALAVASFRLVEQPVRFRVQWAHGSRGRAAFVLSGVAAVVVWVSIPVPTTTNAVNTDALAAMIEPATTSVASTVTQPPTSQPGTTSTSTTSPSTTSSTTTTSTTIAPIGPPVGTILWYGDSIAYDTWPPLSAALTASGLDAYTGAYGGVGLVARDGFADPFGVLATHLDEVDPDLLVMQVSIWDGYETSEDQIAAFDQLGSLLTERQLRTVLVTIPVRSAEQADPGEVVLTENATRFASDHDLVILLNQSEVFGDRFQLDVDGDGNPERKRDGVHLCPTGALSVTLWLVKQLSVHYEGIALPETNEWILGDWRMNERYDDPPGACAGL